LFELSLVWSSTFCLGAHVVNPETRSLVPHVADRTQHPRNFASLHDLWYEIKNLEREVLKTWGILVVGVRFRSWAFRSGLTHCYRREWASAASCCPHSFVLVRSECHVFVEKTLGSRRDAEVIIGESFRIFWRTFCRRKRLPNGRKFCRKAALLLDLWTPQRRCVWIEEGPSWAFPAWRDIFQLKFSILLVVLSCTIIAFSRVHNFAEIPLDLSVVACSVLKFNVIWRGNPTAAVILAKQLRSYPAGNVGVWKSSVCNWLSVSWSLEHR